MHPLEPPCLVARDAPVFDTRPLALLIPPPLGARWWPPRPWLARAAARLRQAVAAWRAAQRRRRDERELQSLSDATLRDLGLDRSEIGSVQAELDGRAVATRVRMSLQGSEWRGC